MPVPYPCKRQHHLDARAALVQRLVVAGRDAVLKDARVVEDHVGDALICGTTRMHTHTQ
jgi:hypothetical protein